jgi:hypothetical protein
MNLSMINAVVIADRIGCSFTASSAHTIAVPTTMHHVVSAILIALQIMFVMLKTSSLLRTLHASL